MTLYSILTVATIGLILTAALYTAFSWVLARLWCKPKRLPATKSPADFEMAFQAIQFFSHGTPVNGWFIPATASASQPPAIVLSHGWCKNSVEMLPLAQLLHQHGFALLVYDARGHGSSGENGPITILKLAEDILAGIDYLATRSDIDQKRLGVLGRSIGGSAAILAASMDRRIRTIVSCSAFADPKSLTKDFLRMKRIPAGLFAPSVFRFIEIWLGTRMDNIAPRNRIGKIDAPLLLIHGDKDWYIRPSNMEDLYARAPRQHTERLLIPKRGHSDVMRDPKCTQEIISFFDRNLHPAENQIASLLPSEVESCQAR